MNQYSPETDSPSSPVINTGLPASSTLFDLSLRTQDLLEEKHPQSLIIGTHPKIPLVGDGLLSSSRFEEAGRTRIVDSPKEVLERLRMLVHQHYRRYACVMAAFEFHHFKGRDLSDFTELLQMLSHGTVIMADYTLAGIHSEVARQETQSRVEVIQQGIYGGFEKWFNDHTVFSTQGFLDTAKDADWKSFTGFTMPNHKTGAIASSSLSQAELTLITNEAIPSARNSLDSYPSVAY